MRISQQSNVKIPGFLLLAYPFIEIFGFIAVGHWLGFLGAIGLLIATTMLGSYLLRSCGFDYKRQMNSGMAGMANLNPKMMFRMFAGFLLVLPGFVSDLAGLLLLLPFVQKILMSKVTDRCKRGTQQYADAKAANDKKKGQIIEGECWHEDDPQDKQ